MPTRRMPSDLIVLDTHVWIWLLNGEAQLAGSPCLPLIEAAVRSSSVSLPRSTPLSNERSIAWRTRAERSSPRVT